MHVQINSLSALATHLEIVTKNNRQSHGWTYDEEVKMLRAAADEIKELRAALKELVEAEDASIEDFTAREISRIEQAMARANAVLKS